MAASYATAAALVGTVIAGITIGAMGAMFIGGLVGMAVAMAGAALIGQPTPPSASALEYARGIMLNRASNAAAIPVIYGRRRVGCSRVFMAVTNRPGETAWVESGYWNYGEGEPWWVDTSGWVITAPAVTNGYLHLVLVLAEGPVSAINEVYFNDIPSTDARFAGLVTIKKHLGADDQAADSDLMAACPEWTADHRLRGVAYIYVQLLYNQTAFPAGLPNITVDVDGRMVYDPRDAQTKFSRNPPLCTRDYLTNARYGRGIPAAMIPDSAIAAAANYCDETVTVGGVQQARYTCDGLINVDDSALENTNNLLTSCRGMLIFSGGLYRLIIDKPEAATFDFDESNLTGAWTITLGSKRNMFNRIRARFFNPAKSWQEDIAPIDSVALRTLDNGLVLETSVYLPFTADVNTAKQITTINLNQSRQQIACQFTAFIKGLRCEVGNVARITHSTPGWVAKKFRVLNMALKNNDEVTVTAREYADAGYDFGTIAVSDPAPNTNLPDLGAVAPPANIAATEQLYWTGTDHLSRVTITWDAPPDAFVASYEIEYRHAA